MSDLTKKILESGLVDEHTAKLMERWGTLPPGSSKLVHDEALAHATKDQLLALAEDISKEVDRQNRLKETMLDLNQLRWPTKVDVIRYTPDGKFDVADKLDAVIDRMGRFYFRAEDVKREWFAPGYHLIRHDLPGEDGHRRIGSEVEIIEVTELNVGEHVAAIQVSTK